MTTRDVLARALDAIDQTLAAVKPPLSPEARVALVRLADARDAVSAELEKTDGSDTRRS